MTMIYLLKECGNFWHVVPKLSLQDRLAMAYRQSNRQQL